MSLRRALRVIQEQHEKYYLISWEPEENSVSVVAASCIVEQERAMIGERCDVIISRKRYAGKIAATGSKKEMERLESRFLSGEYSPFESEVAVLPDILSSSPKASVGSQPNGTSTKRKNSVAANKENMPTKRKKIGGKVGQAKQDQTKTKPKSKQSGNIITVTMHGGVLSTDESNPPPADSVTSEPPEYSTGALPLADTDHINEPPSPEHQTPLMSPHASPIVSHSPFDAHSSLSSSDMSESDCELSVRVEDLEVRLMRMENIQTHILASLWQMEKNFQYQVHGHAPSNNPLPQPSFFQYQQPCPQPNYYQPPAQHSYFQHDSCVLSDSSFGEVTQQPNSQTQQFFQRNGSASSDPSVSMSQSLSQTPDASGVNTSVQLCRILLPLNASVILPSSEIPKHTLRDVQEVLEENSKLRSESSAGTLCQKLAKEAIFGKNIMERCTPNGTREFPALPREELFTLKVTMFQQFPRFHSCPEAFESVWKRCDIN